MNRLDYATPEPDDTGTIGDLIATFLIAVPSVLAGFTAAALLGAHLAFLSATIYLGHFPTTINTPSSAIPFKAIAPGLIALPAAIVFTAMIGRLMLCHPRCCGRRAVQLIVPSVLFVALFAIHMLDPFGVRVWMFE